MKYVISDIHGCYDQFRALTERIGIRASDTLYILGDCVDKGPEPVRVLQDLAARDNVTILMGNHDAAALKVLRRLPEGVNEMNFRSLLPREDRLPYIFWMRTGAGSLRSSSWPCPAGSGTGSWILWVPFCHMRRQKPAAGILSWFTRGYMTSRRTVPCPPIP